VDRAVTAADEKIGYTFMGKFADVDGELRKGFEEAHFNAWRAFKPSHQFKALGIALA
jgi:hypothetical protein